VNSITRRSRLLTALNVDPEDDHWKSNGTTSVLSILVKTQQASNESSPTIGTQIVDPHTKDKTVGVPSRYRERDSYSERPSIVKEGRRHSVSVSSRRNQEGLKFDEVEVQLQGSKGSGRIAPASRRYSHVKIPSARSGQMLGSSSSSSSSATLSRMLEEFNRSSISLPTPPSKDIEHSASLPANNDDLISGGVFPATNRTRVDSKVGQSTTVNGRTREEGWNKPSSSVRKHEESSETPLQQVPAKVCC